MGQVATPAQFRIKFDVPHSGAVEPGFVRDQHCHDMRPAAGGQVNTWQDPVTGLIMLQPSFLNESFYTAANWQPLSAWTYNAAYWQQVFGNVDLGGSTAAFFSTVLSSAAGTPLLPALAGVGTAALSLASSLTNDTLHWALQSTFSMPVDGGFVWHYHAIADEKHQYRNWFALQLDDLGLTFSYDGTVSFWQYGSDHTVAPTLLDSTIICSPGDVAARAGYFIVIPVPGMGLNIYHSFTAQRLDAKTSSAVSGVTKGYQFKLNRKDSGTGLPYVHKGGALTVGVGALLNLAQHKFGYHAITYPTGTNCGSFAEAAFDIGYQPTHIQTTSIATLLPSFDGSGTVDTFILDPATGSTWAPASSPTTPVQQAQVQMKISNSTANNTPFIYSSYVYWLAIFSTRATTATLPDRLFQLEFTDDDLGHFEGSATTMATSDAYRAICERGDTTFQIEKSLDSGTTWEIHNGGLAKIDGSVEVRMDANGIYYVARWALAGKESRFHEVTHINLSAFDNLTPGASINKVLIASSEPVVASLPAGVTANTLPVETIGSSFHYAPRIGETGDEIIKHMLLLCRKATTEYRCYYSWATAAWLIDAKPRDTSAGATWTLTPFADELDLSTRNVNIATGDGNKLFDFAVAPPEGNLIAPYGVASPEPSSARIAGTVLVNGDSLNTPTSPDYLGRTKILSAFFAPVSDLATINIMGRRMYDAAAHRRLQPTIPGREYIDALKPGLQCYIRGVTAAGDRGFFAGSFTGSGESLTAVPLAFWLKRRTVALDYNGSAGDASPTVTYTLDTIWASDLD